MVGNIRKAAKVLEDIIKLSIDIERDIRCKFCNSRNIVRNGKRKGTQDWLCKECGRSFVNNKALPKMKYSIENIASAVYLYYTGLSLNEIRSHIEQHHNVLPSSSTIYSWITHFTKIATDKAKEYLPNVGDTWVADETVLNIGGKKYWLWDIIDSDTRFLLATYLSPTRTTKDAQKNWSVVSPIDKNLEFETINKILSCTFYVFIRDLFAYEPTEKDIIIAGLDKPNIKISIYENDNMIDQIVFGNTFTTDETNTYFRTSKSPIIYITRASISSDINKILNDVFGV